MIQYAKVAQEMCDRRGPGDLFITILIIFLRHLDGIITRIMIAKLANRITTRTVEILTLLL